MEKLELKHLSPYFPYGLQMISTALGKPARGLKKIETLTTENYYLLTFLNRKPLLMPLYFIQQDIIVEQFFEDNGELLGEEFSAASKAKRFLSEVNKLDICFPYTTWELFFRHHIDIFGLIDAGIALDKSQYIK